MKSHALISVICGVLLTRSLSAQVGAPVENPGERFRRDQLRIQREQNLDKPPETLDLGQPTQESSVELPEDEPGFLINRVELEGNTHLDAEAIREVVAPYEGKEINRAGINKMITALTNAYIDRGWATTRVYIQPQNIAQTKLLKLRVIEGRIESIHINANSWRDRLRARMAFPDWTGEGLNMFALEQGLDQLNHAPSARAQLQLQPGEKEGGSIVDVKNEAAFPWRANASYDNLGQGSTGRDRVRGTTEVDNLLALNETLSAYYLGARNLNAVGASLHVPCQWWNLHAEASYSEYNSILSPDAELFGTFWNLSGGVGQVFYRDREHKFSGDVSLAVNEAGRFINDVLLQPQRLTTLKIGVTEVWRPDNGVWQVDVNYRRGLDALGASVDPQGLPDDAPHAQFNRWEMNVYRYQPLTSWLAFRTSVAGQYSLEGLYGSEQIIMGDFYTVRGYRDSATAGDDGVFARNELLFSFPLETKNSFANQVIRQLQPYAFFDAGWCEFKATDTDQYLSGTGIGLRLPAERFNFDVSYSIPVSHSAAVPEIDGLFYATATVKFF